MTAPQFNTCHLLASLLFVTASGTTALAAVSNATADSNVKQALRLDRRIDGDQIESTVKGVDYPWGEYHNE